MISSKWTFKCVMFCFQLLGASRFHILAHHVVIGNQIIVRGVGKTLIISFLEALTVSLSDVTLVHYCAFFTQKQMLIFVIIKCVLLH